MGNNIFGSKQDNINCKKNEEKINILIFGNTCIGKSLLLNKLNDDHAHRCATSSIRIVKLHKLNAMAFDCTGGKRYKFLISSLSNKIDFPILCFSLNNMESFNDLDIWYDIIKINFNKDEYKNKLILLGINYKNNNNSICHEKVINYEKAYSCAEKYKMRYYEVDFDTQTNEEIQNIFKEILNRK